MQTSNYILEGFTGADLASLANGAAIVAARKGEELVDVTDFKVSLKRMLTTRLEMAENCPDSSGVYTKKEETISERIESVD